MNRYTIFATWAKLRTTEEIDVDATSRSDAVKQATDQLREHYRPGWKITNVVKRLQVPGWIIFY